ncbi:MAG: ABC transporter permease [Firmicutes bacterium]|nr:ABC transporter permease [Bacillota bacterium]
MKSKNAITPILSILIYIFLWAPVVLLIVFSFSKNRFGIRWEGFTLQWYADIFRSVPVKEALMKSLVIALITVVVATILGTIAAYGMYKYKFRGKETLRTTMLIPMVMPSVVTGAALLVFYKSTGIPLGYFSIIIAHITFCSPLAAFVVLGRMMRMDWSLEEASADLGANRLTTLAKVTVPALLPAMIASATLIFPWSFDDFIITYFVAGVGTTTLPIYIFSQLRFGVSPVINTIGTIFVAIPVIGILFITFFQKKQTSH